MNVVAAVALLLAGGSQITKGQLTPLQTPAEASRRIQALAGTTWWLQPPPVVQKIWDVYLRGGYDCTLSGARARKCFYVTEREACGNDEFMFGAVGTDVLLQEFGVLACTQERQAAETLMRRWRSIMKPPESARVSKRDEPLRVSLEYAWEATPGTFTMLLTASAYSEFGWQVHMYLKLDRAE